MKRKNRSQLNIETKKKLNNQPRFIKKIYESFSLSSEVYKVGDLVVLNGKTDEKFAYGQIKSIFSKEDNPHEFFVILIKSKIIS